MTRAFLSPPRSEASLRGRQFNAERPTTVPPSQTESNHLSTPVPANHDKKKKNKKNKPTAATSKTNNTAQTPHQEFNSSQTVPSSSQPTTTVPSSSNEAKISNTGGSTTPASAAKPASDGVAKDNNSVAQIFFDPLRQLSTHGEFLHTIFESF